MHPNLKFASQLQSLVHYDCVAPDYVFVSLQIPSIQLQRMRQKLRKFATQSVHLEMVSGFLHVLHASNLHLHANQQTTAFTLTDEEKLPL